MTAKEIMKNWLQEHYYDGLCHVPTECGCGLDDLIGPCEGMQEDCQPAHKITDDQESPWYVVGWKKPPTKKQVSDYRRKMGWENEE